MKDDDNDFLLTTKIQKSKSKIKIKITKRIGKDNRHLFLKKMSKRKFYLGVAADSSDYDMYLELNNLIYPN